MDVLTCGEALIDFVCTEYGVSIEDAPAFTKAPGGAPANVAVGVARLGFESGFMGQVGDDEFGRFLERTLRESGVDTGGMTYSKDARTALAFVSLLDGGERDFVFFRNPSADMLWRPQDVDKSRAVAARIFHFGSISLISEPGRSATLTALEYARASGAVISYDPNLRPPLWSSLEIARNEMMEGLRCADVVKLSEEEAAFLSGCDDPRKAVRSLWHGGLRLVVVTAGKRGSWYFVADGEGFVEGFEVEAVDTTGCGDGFMAGLLTGLLKVDFRLERSILMQVLRRANTVGALTAMRYGAIPALPTRAELEGFLTEQI